LVRKDDEPAPQRKPHDDISEAISGNLHRIIENTQIIILTAELLKEEILSDAEVRVAVRDLVEQIISCATDEAVLISDVRKKLKQLLGK
jgi:hypothetical protein